MGYVHYFLYKEISELIEKFAKDGSKEFYPSVINEATGAEPKDYLPILENLEGKEVIKRKFITDLGENDNYTVVPIRELGKHDPKEVYVKYEITKEFAECVVNKENL